MITDVVIIAFVMKWAGVTGSWVWAHKIVTVLAGAVVIIMAVAAKRPDDHKERRHYRRTGP